MSIIKRFWQKEANFWKIFFGLDLDPPKQPQGPIAPTYNSHNYNYNLTIVGFFWVAPAREVTTHNYNYNSPITTPLQSV